MALFSDLGGWFDRLGDNKFSTTAGVPKAFESISVFTEKIATSATDAAKPRPRASDKTDHDARRISASKPKHPRLSRSVHLMRSEYDVVVIGSGYGGGVAASRMARAGKSVAVLEMGKEKWPGEYPSTLMEVLPEFHISGSTGRATASCKSVAAGSSTGMYNLVLGHGQNAFVGKGLGGTSLINANVYLECDKRTLALGAWPSELRTDPSALEPYYTRAAEMLQPTAYPEDLPTPKKLSVLEKQAEALGQKQNFYRAPQTTFFQEGLNHAGVQMKASTCSGQDCTGVNDGSKNSVLMNYIPDAWNWGAEMFCECEVRHISRDATGDGYVIFFAWHGAGREKFGDHFHRSLMWVRAKELCFLGAGSLGTTEILLRSRAHGLELSPMVGQKLSGNGDILSFGYDTDEVVNGIGRAKPTTDPPSGPTITGIIDNRDAISSPNVLDAYIMQEGAIPEALAPLIQSMLELLPGKQQPERSNAKDQLQHLMSRAEARFLGPYSKGGSVNRTQVYLIMSHDSNEAILSLENDKPRLQFLGVGRTEHVKKLNGVLAKATHAIGGTLVNTPFHAAFNQQEQITVHPLGGVVMSSDGTGRRGATNHLGQVFSGEGSEVHKGLVCVDGAVIPTSLGVNPFATITALTERSVDLIARQRGLRINWTKNGRLDLFGSPARSFPSPPDLARAHKVMQITAATGGVQFTEIMEGHIHVGNDLDDFASAEETAKSSSSSGLLYLSVSSPRRRNQDAVATGTLSCRALSKDPLLVRGRVEFFSADKSVSEGSNLVYSLTLQSTDGMAYHMHGKKDLTPEMAFSVTSTWRATTVLRTTITNTDGLLAGKGILRIPWRNFTSELKTLQSTLPNGNNLLDRASTVADFVGNFAQNTASFYLGPLGKLQLSPPKADIIPDGSLPPKPAPISTIQLTAADGVPSTLRTWAATTAPPTQKHHILMIPGASVSHEIFALPTVPTNAVDYLTARGHAVSVLSHRFAATPVSARGGTCHEARLDVLAALQHLRAEQQQQGQQKRTIYVVAHCMGAVATAIGLLDGTIPAAWLAGLTCTQVFAHLVFGKWNALKAGSPWLPEAYAGVAGSQWFPMTAEEEDREEEAGRAGGKEGRVVVQRLIDQALRFYPVERRAEVCRSAVCHRFSLTYGRCWEHANLNKETHDGLANVLGGVHMRMLRQTMAMGRAGRVLDGEGKDTVATDEGLERLRGLPILFVSGGANVVFDPESTFITYDVLRRRFGPDLYQRRVVQGYGHLDTWMGKNSVRDVFPVIGDHISSL
ncbi:glucose-methanol-choline oxidoreductase [Diplodia corticola]|uniref:Cholesterol oxidase n=1 Tax=Diplodia corticola TaxID=236234 RepID=A0A1J9RZB2_9PEZI|nr:glucose-methanol-choline oxidoreductase [Diplodia corticola]OJD33687.1 glucose-methanol-choline oxidoreductase [Diplodia corticola]